jgi:hypothetical protein
MLRPAGKVIENMRRELIKERFVGYEFANRLPPIGSYIRPISSRMMTMVTRRPNPPLG